MFVQAEGGSWWWGGGVGVHLNSRGGADGPRTGKVCARMQILVSGPEHGARRAASALHAWRAGRDLLPGHLVQTTNMLV